MTIAVLLKGQTITATAPELAEQSLGKLFCKIDADQEWDGLDLKLVFQLRSGKCEPITRQVRVSDPLAVPVPDACIRPGELFIAAVGESGTHTRMTAGYMPFGIPISPIIALTAKAAEQLTTSEFEQLMTIIGPMAQLETEDKDSLVAAINWLKNNGSAAAEAVLYTVQELEEAQQDQARINIKAQRDLEAGLTVADKGKIVEVGEDLKLGLVAVENAEETAV